MLDKLTRETFESSRGETFKLCAEGPDTGKIEVELQLADVQGTGLRGKAKHEQFSVYFNGPGEPLLPQSIYHLEHAGMGAIDVFLVPVARDDAGVTYEAVFT